MMDRSSGYMCQSMPSAEYAANSRPPPRRSGSTWWYQRLIVPLYRLRGSGSCGSFSATPNSPFIAEVSMRLFRFDPSCSTMPRSGLCHSNPSSDTAYARAYSSSLPGSSSGSSSNTGYHALNSFSSASYRLGAIDSGFPGCLTGISGTLRSIQMSSTT